ncbi:MAG: phosphoribosylamine--glycine ligase N-terminal domain-containing protein, partial [Ignavibacteria bacterium]
MKLKVLVLGSGGREDALCWKISQSNLLDKLYCVPGNPGT